MNKAQPIIDIEQEEKENKYDYQINANQVIVKRINQETTYRLWQKHSLMLSKHYWKSKIFWSDGYFEFNIGEVSSATIQRYVETQG